MNDSFIYEVQFQITNENIEICISNDHLWKPLTILMEMIEYAGSISKTPLGLRRSEYFQYLSWLGVNI